MTHKIWKTTQTLHESVEPKIVRKDKSFVLRIQVCNDAWPTGGNPHLDNRTKNVRYKKGTPFYSIKPKFTHDQLKYIADKAKLTGRTRYSLLNDIVLNQKYRWIQSDINENRFRSTEGKKSLFYLTLPAYNLFKTKGGERWLRTVLNYIISRETTLGIDTNTGHRPRSTQSVQSERLNNSI